jgi:acyl carrier protein
LIRRRKAFSHKIRRIYSMDFNKVKEVVAEQLGVEVTELSAETSLKKDLNADSLDLFQIIMSLEEVFDIEIPTEDTENIDTIGDIENYLESRK